MRDRRDELNRIQIRSACHVAWDAMERRGPAERDARRYCDHCQCEVYDFAQLTAREASAIVEASHGELCAHLTRLDGRLVTLPAPQPPAGPLLLRRSSPLTAGLASAWLGLASPAAGSQEPATATATAPPASTAASESEGQPPEAPHPHDRQPTAGITGQVHDESGLPVAGVEITATNKLDGSEHRVLSDRDGRFAFAALEDGLYDVKGTKEVFDSAHARDLLVQAGENLDLELQVTSGVEVSEVGAIVITAEPLRQVLARSDLVVIGTLGGSRQVEDRAHARRTATELIVDKVLRGKVPATTVSYYHWSLGDTPPRDRFDSEPLSPGTRVLAFLSADHQESTPAAFESADSVFALHRLEGDATAAYERAISDLIHLEEEGERRGEVPLDELVDWLVATTVQPATRSEASAEVSFAAFELHRLAKQWRQSPEATAEDLLALYDRFRAEGGRLQHTLQPALLGAALRPAHHRRLTAALKATPDLGNDDFSLFYAVLSWDETAALRWLTDRLHHGQGHLEDWQVDALVLNLAERLASPEIMAVYTHVGAKAQRVDYGTEESDHLSVEERNREGRRLRQEEIDGLLDVLRRRK